MPTAQATLRPNYIRISGGRTQEWCCVKAPASQPSALGFFLIWERCSLCRPELGLQCIYEAFRNQAEMQILISQGRDRVWGSVLWQLVCRLHCEQQGWRFEGLSVDYLTIMEDSCHSEPGMSPSCRCRAVMVSGRSGAVGFVIQNKTNVCVPCWVSLGVVLTRVLTASC